MRISIGSCKIPPGDGGSETRVRLSIHRNERNPLMVAEQKVIVPNERRAPCSHELKILPFRRYIAQLPKPLTMMLGMDWKEQHRLEAPRKAYEALGYQVDYPLSVPWYSGMNL
jgi:3'-phosphoadenosine 5'-phosphosulfate sulfotransferase (PAPS reductase)/FAD synthetase